MCWLLEERIVESSALSVHGSSGSVVRGGLHGGGSDAAVSERSGGGLAAWGTEAQDGSCLPENIEKQV